MVIEQENIREIDDDLTETTLTGSSQDNVAELHPTISTKHCREQLSHIKQFLQSQEIATNNLIDGLDSITDFIDNLPFKQPKIKSFLNNYLNRF